MKKVILTEEQKSALRKFSERLKKVELNQTFKHSKKAEEAK
jgi:hypothetical protein